MAIAEVAARVGIFTRVAEAKAKPLAKEAIEIPPIRQFAPEEATDLALRYLNTRWFLLGKDLKTMTEGEARDFGVTEIQGVVLNMLGHGDLLPDRVVKLAVAQNLTVQIYRVRSLEKEDITILAERYRTARKLSIKGEFARRVWTNKKGRELKPEEARIQGNMFELTTVLEQLGQAELLKATDREVPNPNEVDWKGNQTPTGGELQ